MAYRRRRYGRRRRRRGNRKFSRFNTYRNRSSKAQAYQIYSLNRKINAIQKRTKPEIKIYQNNYSFNASEYCGNLFGGCTTALDSIMQGKIARIQNINNWFTVWKDPSMAGVEFTFTIRIVMYQYREALPSVQTTPEKIFNITEQDLTNQNLTIRKRKLMTALYGPLRQGVSAKFKILRDFKMYLGPTRERANKCAYLRKPFTLQKGDNNQDYPKGTILWQALLTSNKDDLALNAIQFNHNLKIAYVDES